VDPPNPELLEFNKLDISLADKFAKSLSKISSIGRNLDS
jgi:hypothetical protein